MPTKKTATNARKTWGIYTYIAGDNNLSSYGLLDIEEMAKAGADAQHIPMALGSIVITYNLDGVSNSSNDRGRGYARVNFIPPSSAVAEFKMQSNPYDATVGHTFGPVVMMSRARSSEAFVVTAGLVLSGLGRGRCVHRGR